jgi:hypothetical protein
MIRIGLFNRIFLPPTCDVAFTTTDSLLTNKLRDIELPTLRDPSYLSDVKVVKITFYPLVEGSRIARIMFINSPNTTISLNRLSPPARNDYLICILKCFFKFLRSNKIARPIETLHFECWRPIVPRANPVPDLTETLEGLKSLKTIVFRQCNTLYFLKSQFPFKEW